MRISENTRRTEYKRNKDNNPPQFKGGREVLRAFTDDPLITTLALEVPCDVGRSTNAYKRGGFPEFRERITDDLISAVFWMKGFDMFNAAGDAFGKHVLKLPETEFDVGKDALRSPFENLVKNKGKELNLNVEAQKKLANKLSVFKFAKIAASAVLAASFMGFIVPKFNQALTEKMMKKKNGVNSDKPSDRFSYPVLNKASFDDFDKKTNSSVPSFKGTGLVRAAYLLENNPICKMLSTDVGMITGRVKTARNKDEGREYFVRDTASAFFYYGSAPIVYKGLQKLSGSSELTDIDAVCAKQLHENFSECLQKSGGMMTVSDFEQKTIGVLDDSAKAVMEKLPFKSDVISLSELQKYISDADVLEKARKMSKLQPEHATLGSVLTRQQVADVFKNGSVNTPEFMQSVYKRKFGAGLTDPYKYIPMKKITSFRENMDNYARKIIETASKENGHVVDANILNKVNKKSFLYSSAFITTALIASAFGLAVLVPKLQYAITKLKTGSNCAPGLREYEQNSK